MQGREKVLVDNWRDPILDQYKMIQQSPKATSDPKRLDHLLALGENELGCRNILPWSTLSSFLDDRVGTI